MRELQVAASKVVISWMTVAYPRLKKFLQPRDASAVCQRGHLVFDCLCRYLFASVDFAIVSPSKCVSVHNLDVFL